MEITVGTAFKDVVVISKIGRRPPCLSRSKGNRSLEQMSIQWQQVHPLHRGSAFGAVGMDRTTHHALTACFSKHFDNSVLISGECASNWLAFHTYAKRKGGHEA
ncbi:hypothetical protein BG61_06760 [Caballeronia glathei]|uniref:Uncharacterized protein n=1 Tax=Caballeronia glathei TaxID=60547 RepID=A0A069PB07_9BURK|nr:hypothetical protein BG61_06760 [Caballeronia glathei]TCK33697.1 hypothetical protein B0G84_7999 [Paraburkholderia sp. BL8N3]